MTPATVAPPAATTIGGLIGELAQRWPEHPAVVHRGTELTFAVLEAEVDRWARSLLALGVRRGESVAVLVGNRPEWLVATAAAAGIGALVTPINTWYKQDELTYALEHSASVVLITAGGQLNQDFTALVSAACPRFAGDRDDGTLPALRTVVGIDPSRPSGAMDRETFLERGRNLPDDEAAAARAAVQGDDDLFLLYTSGSTARPKGVLLTHRATIANDFAIGERMGLDPTDRAWVAIPLFYGFAAVNAVVAVWSHGGALVLQESFDAEAALDLIAAERVTVYYGLGNMTRALLAAQASAPRHISTLTKGLTGYSYEDKRLVVEDLGVEGCCSIYGLTESHGLAAMTDRRDPAEVRLTSDGRALPAWELRVVDPVTEEPVAPGDTGHLLIRGFLTSGYRGDPELTASVLTADGFFRTGDLVRVDRDGNLHFHSRLKEVIKTGGINVSPLEVEHVLETHPAVSQALVFGVPDDERGEAVVAVARLRDGAAVTEAELRAHVKEHAAGFKVPRRVVFRSAESLPRLASGKIAKRILRDEVIAVMSEGARS